MTRQRRSTRCWHRNDLRFREGGYSPSRKKSGESRCSDADGKKKIASRPAAVDAGIAVSAGRFCADGAFCALSAGSEYLDQLYRLQCHPEPTQCMGRPPELSQPAVISEIAANLHCPLNNRASVCGTIIDQYTFAQIRGLDPCPDDPQPPIDDLKIHYKAGRAAAENGALGYIGRRKE